MRDQNLPANKGQTDQKTYQRGKAENIKIITRRINRAIKF